MAGRDSCVIFTTWSYYK